MLCVVLLSLLLSTPVHGLCPTRVQAVVLGRGLVTHVVENRWQYSAARAETNHSLIVDMSRQHVVDELVALAATPMFSRGPLIMSLPVDLEVRVFRETTLHAQMIKHFKASGHYQSSHATVRVVYVAHQEIMHIECEHVGNSQDAFIRPEPSYDESCYSCPHNVHSIQVFVEGHGPLSRSDGAVQLFMRDDHSQPFVASRVQGEKVNKLLNTLTRHHDVPHSTTLTRIYMFGGGEKHSGVYHDGQGEFYDFVAVDGQELIGVQIKWYHWPLLMIRMVWYWWTSITSFLFLIGQIKTLGKVSYIVKVVFCHLIMPYLVTRKISQVVTGRSNPPRAAKYKAFDRIRNVYRAH